MINIIKFISATALGVILAALAEVVFLFAIAEVIGEGYMKNWEPNFSTAFIAGTYLMFLFFSCIITAELFDFSVAE